MAQKTSKLNDDVTEFVNQLQHPLRTEIEQLRKLILSANDNIIENIKWNGPNYSFNCQDRISMRVQPAQKLQLIFHCGAKVKAQPTEKLIANDFGLLLWRSNDRAIATFKNIVEIKNSAPNLISIISQWLLATNQN